MDYTQKLQYHYQPEMGRVNDPNGLVYFDGYYHVFYQYRPEQGRPAKKPVHWGHARTKDFLHWEELPIALFPDQAYDESGCWSGTAIVKDGRLYLFYASIRGEEKQQTVSVAWSDDGVRFEKYAGNPVIDHYPEDGGPDFRDPAVCAVNGEYYCVMATGNPATKTARLLLYKSRDLLSWEYAGILCQWEDCHYNECPSLVAAGEEFLLSASVVPLESDHYFSIMLGTFKDDKFRVRLSGEVDKGPDQYAGQIFSDHLGRTILITWLPGWNYYGFADKDVGCMSVPREITVTDGTIRAYPIKEIQHLLTEEDPCLRRTEAGFVVERIGREPLIYEGEIRDLKILRDGYIAEIFVNGGEEVYSVLL